MLSKKSLFKFAICYNFAAIIFQIIVDFAVRDNLGKALKQYFLTYKIRVLKID